jgi:hypothetical protein
MQNLHRKRICEDIFSGVSVRAKGGGADTAEALMTRQTWADSTLQTERDRKGRLWWRERGREDCGGGREGGKTVGVGERGRLYPSSTCEGGKIFQRDADQTRKKGGRVGESC